MNIDNRVVVMQYCTSPRWFIRLDPYKRIPRGDTVPVWSTCPGSLYEDYETAREACAVARWWGFEPEVQEHEHRR